MVPLASCGRRASVVGDRCRGHLVPRRACAARANRGPLQRGHRRKDNRRGLFPGSMRNQRTAGQPRRPPRRSRHCKPQLHGPLQHKSRSGRPAHHDHTTDGRSAQRSPMRSAACVHLVGHSCVLPLGADLAPIVLRTGSRSDDPCLRPRHTHDAPRHARVPSTQRRGALRPRNLPADRRKSERASGRKPVRSQPRADTPNRQRSPRAPRRREAEARPR